MFGTDELSDDGSTDDGSTDGRSTDDGPTDDVSTEDGSRDGDRSWPWAAGLGDRGRAAAALALAAHALGRRTNGTVGKDRVAGRLTVMADPGAERLVIELGRLVPSLAGEPVARWPALIADFVDAAVEATDRIAEIRFGDWRVARPRLIMRVVPDANCGPLGRKIGSGLSLDVGIIVDLESIAEIDLESIAEIDLESIAEIDLDATAGQSGHGHTPLAVVDSDLIERWAVPTDRIETAARANTLRLVRPEVVISTTGGGRGRPSVTVLRGGPLTTGIMIDPLHFLERVGRRPIPADHGVWVSALDPSTVLVIDAPADRLPAVRHLVGAWFARCRGGFAPNIAPAGHPAEPPGRTDRRRL